MTPPGFSAAYMVSAAGVLVYAPHRIVSHGIIVTSRSREAAVVILPATAVEDPKFGPILNQTGLYRVEDSTGTIARIGQGRILDRIRRHRARPIVHPHRVIAASPVGAPWSVAQRCYLEARLADHWLAAGHALASSIFIRDYPTLDLAEQRRMDGVMEGLLGLMAAGLRVEEPGNPLGFIPLDRETSSKAAPRNSPWFRQFPPGTRLEYTDTAIRASALARKRDVVLLPESLVHLSLSAAVGRDFREEHRHFLEEAGVLDVGDGVGRTANAVAWPTAAGLLKRATGGRIHNADKWRPLRPMPTWRGAAQ